MYSYTLALSHPYTPILLHSYNLKLSPLLREQVIYVAAAVLCSLLTTPLDVARTRLLLERRTVPLSLRERDGGGGTSDDGGGTSDDGGGTSDVVGDTRDDDTWAGLQSPARLWGTVGTIAREEGVEALFRGATFRVLYTGIVVAALIPIRTLGYVAVRDWLILELLN